MPLSHSDVIFPGIVRFTDTAGCNSYWIEIAAGCFLIDPFESLRPSMLPGGGSLDGILITHMQREHVAGVSQFEGVPVFLAAESVWLCGVDEKYEVEQWGEPWDWESRGNYRGHLAGARNERPFRIPQERLRPLPASLPIAGIRAIRTPGHGKHAVTYLVEHPVGLIGFCGDLIYSGARLWNWYDCEWDYGLETGPRSLCDSLLRLAEAKPAWLLPSHGAAIADPQDEIRQLQAKVEAVLVPINAHAGPTINMPDRDSAAPGFREITKHVHQWRNGNTIILLSEDRRAIVIDDGLCLWRPWDEKIRIHDQVFREAFAALRIEAVELIVATHFHGDHVDLMGKLSRDTGAPIATLPCVADVLENPDDFNLACMLPWYGTPEPRIAVNERIAPNTTRRWRGLDLNFFLLGGQTGRHLGLSTTVDGCRVTFAGDAWWGTSAQPFTPLCWNDAPPRERGWVYSLDRLIEQGPDLLVAGHGCVLSNPLLLLREARENWDPCLKAYDELNPHPSEEAFFRPFNEN